MPSRRPFRFAVQSFAAGSADEWRERARKAEAQGYAALHLADHFIGPGPAQAATAHPPQEIAAVPAIALAAEATTTLRVGCRVFCIDYRHPVMLAKEAATLDLFSEGRLDLGLGAGWLQGEYEAAGIPFDPAGRRIERLGEVVGLVRAFMADGEIDFRGDHFQVSGFEGLPKPVQRPHPPITIGGGGEKVLRLAAREANVVSFNFNNRSGVLGADGIASSTAEETAKKIAWVRDEAGARFDELDLEIGAYFAFPSESGRQTADAMAPAFGLTPDAMRAHPHALLGTSDEMCDELLRRREETGIHVVTVGDGVMDAFAPVVARLAGT